MAQCWFLAFSNYTVVFHNVGSRDMGEGNSTILATYPAFKSSCLFLHISKPFSFVTLPCSKYMISMLPLPILNYFKIRTGKKQTNPMLSNYSMPHYLEEYTVWNLFYIGNGRRYINVLWTEKVTKGMVFEMWRNEQEDLHRQDLPS